MRMARLLVLVLCPTLAFALVGPPAGEFLGPIRTEWLSRDTEGAARKMRLLNDVAYRDPAGKVWTAPKGTVVDGASIPRVFWPVVGSPFVGDYRDASVVHDYYCDAQTESWQDVHEMFYWASLAAGVGEAKAKVLYAAVLAGGPRWGPGQWPIDRDDQYYAIWDDFAGQGWHLFEPPRTRWTPKSRQAPNRPIGEQEARAIADWVTRENPDLTAIKKEMSAYVDGSPPAVSPLPGISPLKDPTEIWRRRFPFGS